MTSNKYLKPSYSRVNAYRMCPHAYKLQYVDKINSNTETKQAVEKAIRGEKDRVASRDLGKMFDIALTKDIDSAKKRLYNKYPKTEYNETQMMLVEFFVNKIRTCLPDGEFGVSLPDDSRLHGDIDYLSESGDVLLDIKYTADPYQYLSPQKTLQVMLYASELPKKPSTIGFLIVPHVHLKQKKGEDLRSYRIRLLQAAAKEGLSIKYVEYDPELVDQFWEDVDKIEKDTEYFPTPGSRCAICNFRGVCEIYHNKPITPN